MALLHLSQVEFERVLAEHVRPSSPIESFEHLFDRVKQLNRIEEALSSPGRHVFIYGDRGAGKTSLAKSAAYKHHPSQGEPVYTACGQKTSFSAIVRDIASQLDQRSAYVAIDRRFAGGGKVAAGGVTLEGSYSQKETQRDLGGMDLNAATTAIKEAVERQPTTDPKVIVIDEFENLPSVEDRRLFAELIKQLSDRGVHVSLIFCGIGKSLDDLLQGHGSAHRYLEEVQLPSPPLTYSGRWAIVDGACQALGFSSPSRRAFDWLSSTNLVPSPSGLPRRRRAAALTHHFLDRPTVGPARRCSTREEPGDLASIFAACRSVKLPFHAKS